MVKGSSEPPAEEIFGATRLGGNPGSLAKRTALATARGSPEPPGELVATGTLGAFLALVGGRAAQRTLRNRRDGAARLGEAPPSHTWRGLVLCLPSLCPTGQKPARTDTPFPPRPFRAPDRRPRRRFSGFTPSARGPRPRSSGDRRHSRRRRGSRPATVRRAWPGRRRPGWLPRIVPSVGPSPR